KGRTAAESEYPATTRGRRRRTRSAHCPDHHLKIAATSSASPSIEPKSRGASGNRAAKNAGKSGKIMSEPTSVNKLTSPSAITALGRADRLAAGSKSRFLARLEQRLELGFGEWSRNAQGSRGMENLCVVLDQLHSEQRLVELRAEGDYPIPGEQEGVVLSAGGFEPLDRLRILG